MVLAQKALTDYNKINTAVRVKEATPHELTSMMFEGALKSLVILPALIKNKKYEEKAKELSRAIQIINALAECLDMKKGGDLAKQLLSLYSYMNKKLFEVASSNDLETISHVHSLLKEISDGWNAIPLSNR